MKFFSKNNKHFKKFISTFKGKDPMMIGILVVVLYLNVFHCNDFSKILVTGILLWYFFNRIFNDFYVAAGFSILSVIIIELLQRRRIQENLEMKSPETKSTGEITIKNDTKEIKEEDEPEPDDTIVNSISSIPESILSVVDKKEEFSSQKQLSEFVQSIDQIQQMVNKLAPTISKGMKVMDKIEKLGFM